MPSSNEPSSTAAPSVSIILSVYNGELYLAATLDSLLAQDDPDFELLIHDDGSTDGTADILAAYAAKDSRIRASSDRNHGIAWCKNHLIQKARGRYLMMMDADDISHPHRLRLQKSYLDADPDCIGLGGGFRLIDADGRPIHNMVDIRQTHEEIDAANLQGIVSLHQPTVMMRTQSVRQIGGYLDDYPMAEDIDMWLRLAEHGTVRNIPEVLISYRVHANSVSGANSALQKDSVRKACEAAWKRRGIDGDFRYSEWRMGEDRASRLTFSMRYGWWAWSSNYRDTWRHYAFASIMIAPWSIDAWKLLVFGAIRRPKKEAQ